MNIPITAGGRALLCAVALAAAHCGTVAVAQVASGDKLPEALKEVRPAAGVCKRDDVQSDANGTPGAPEIQPDLGCAIPVSEIQSLRARTDTALIDLRPGAEHQAFHIPSAINLSLSDLHSKPYWRGKTVVLVGNGKAERELYRACARLKQFGYKHVRVLRGGMPQWLAHNQAVTGRIPSTPQLIRLSAAEFWLENQNPDNLVVLSKEQNALQSDLAFSVTLAQTTGEAVKDVLDRRRKALKNAPVASVLLAASPSVTDEQIQQLQHAIMPVPLLVYAGTRDAFLQQRGVQKAIWLAQARGPRQPGCGL